MSRLLYPPENAVSYTPFQLTSEMRLVDIFFASSPTAYRIPFLFSAPARVVVKVSSNIGDEKGWRRAGSIAQVLVGLPDDATKTVQRIYLDSAFLELDGQGYSYYLEFWAVRWLTDYQIDVWAQLAPSAVVVVDSQPFTIDGEVFTINGVQLVL